jgi:hypothetical protein
MLSLGNKGSSFVQSAWMTRLRNKERGFKRFLSVLVEEHSPSICYHDLLYHISRPIPSNSAILVK